ncbi:Cof-type HAD-IIB family hydrolase [Oceanobacillus senegalensis]|uniref:Cof-type HAD-IIB family hydrolase n=1 Tax=Oceanobacillus senegalensis TaxID=1936063 RepID=UPI000A306CF8|nr:Cof-type HAD-IIB family hydrolase [Oceanobacillus senegalensis]
MKMIASDMDGTLLNEKGKISKENELAIKKAMEKGITFVAATGRGFESANKPLQAKGITSPIISLNGAKTYDQNHQLIHEVSMDFSISKKILSVCQQKEMYIELFTNHGIYSLAQGDYMDIIITIMKMVRKDAHEDEIRHMMEQRFKLEKVHFIRHYEELASISDLKVYKILCFSDNDEVLNQAFNTLENAPGMVITSSGTWNLEFNHPDAQKDIALKFLANRMGIRMEDIMTIGDNLNDKSMLSKAGRGVAMGNALDEIKEICKYTTKTNNENGVAFAIEEMLEDYNL